MSPSPPFVALRTYAAIRISIVAVILGLAVSVILEIRRVDGCVQRSLSAYYYTPARSIFVGALIALGVAMIALWGKTAAEDAFFNLAGMLAPVVAFVPTLDANSCGISKAVQTAQTQKSLDDALIDANAPSVHNNFVALVAVLVGVLLFTLIGGIVRYRTTDTPPSMQALVGFIATWIAAAAAVVFFVIVYQDADDNDSFFNHRLHYVSAIVLFGFVILAVAAAAVKKRIDSGPWTAWEIGYWVLAVVMAGSALVIKLTAGSDGSWYDRHSTFVMEAILIGLLAVFWVVQTIDRRHDGAPTY